MHRRVLLHLRFTSANRPGKCVSFFVHFFLSFLLLVQFIEIMASHETNGETIEIALGDVERALRDYESIEIEICPNVRSQMW